MLSIKVLLSLSTYRTHLVIFNTRCHFFSDAASLNKPIFVLGLISPGVSVPVQVPGSTVPGHSDVSHAMQVAAAAQYGSRWVS